PPQDGGAARRARRRGGLPRPARGREGAGRARPRRHHAGGDRAVDPRRDHRRATARPTPTPTLKGYRTMQMADSERILASKDKVWASLNDPEVLRRCIPGCQALEMASPTEMAATVVIKIGPVKATFGGKVTLSELDPPNSYRIAGEGNGGIAGFA